MNNDIDEPSPAEFPDDLPYYFKPIDLEAREISRDRIQTWLRRGWVEHISHGLYRITSAPASQYETVAMICARVPDAVICLLTALQIHGIGTQSPKDIWLAIDRKAMEPVLYQFPVRLFRFSRKMMLYAVDPFDIQGVEARITSPARTVVDCFRFRNKIGLDVSIEALKDVLSTRKATVTEILRAAEVCRAKTVIRPYLEVVTS